jgi:phosphatidylglycerophosphate synthase
MSLKQWDIINSLFWALGLLIFHLTGLVWSVPAVGLLSVVLLWGTQWYTISHIRPAGGYANLITLIRHLLILIIAVLYFTLSVRIIGWLLIIPVLLDGVDGYVARRMNQRTKFGALFDLETDSVFMAVSGLLLYHRHLAGVWLLPAAYLRYFYVIMFSLLHLNNLPEKRTLLGPAIALIMFVSILAEYIFQSAFTRYILMAATGLIVLSYGYSFVNALFHRSAE